MRCEICNVKLQAYCHLCNKVVNGSSFAEHKKRFHTADTNNVPTSTEIAGNFFVATEERGSSTTQYHANSNASPPAVPAQNVPVPNNFTVPAPFPVPTVPISPHLKNLSYSSTSIAESVINLFISEFSKLQTTQPLPPNFISTITAAFEGEYIMNLLRYIGTLSASDDSQPHNESPCKTPPSTRHSLSARTEIDIGQFNLMDGWEEKEGSSFKLPPKKYQLHVRAPKYTSMHCWVVSWYQSTTDFSRLKAVRMRSFTANEYVLPDVNFRGGVLILAIFKIIAGQFYTKYITIEEKDLKKETPLSKLPTQPEILVKRTFFQNLTIGFSKLLV